MSSTSGAKLATAPPCGRFAELEPISHLSDVIASLDLCDNAEDLKMKVQVFNSKRGPLADLVAKAKAANQDLLKARQKTSSSGEKKNKDKSNEGKSSGSWESKRAGCLFEVAAEIGSALPQCQSHHPSGEERHADASELTAKGSPYITTVAPAEMLGPWAPECQAFIDKLRSTISADEATVSKQDCKAWVNAPEAVHKAVQLYASNILTSISVDHQTACRFAELRSAMDTQAFCGLKSEDIVHVEKDLMPKISITMEGERRVVITPGLQLAKFMIAQGVSASVAVTTGKLQDRDRGVASCPPPS